MTTSAASPPTPAAAPARKPAPPKAAKKTDGGTDGNTKMVSVRLTRSQIAEVERWRALYSGLDLGTAVRVLIALGLRARPRKVVDPLGVASATHARLK